MEPLPTVVETLNKLKEEGYTFDLNFKGSHLEDPDCTLKLHPADFVVDEFFRFEGASDPDDEAIIYAISSPKYGIKGTLVNAFGIYSDSMSDEMVKALEIKR